MHKISVVIADDQALIRNGLRRMLEGEPQISVCGEAPNGRDLLALFGRVLPDVLLLDLRMPQMDGMQVIGTVAEKGWPVAVVVISQYMEVRLVDQLKAAGVLGFLDKDAEKSEVLTAIREADAGRCFYSAGIRARLKARNEGGQPDKAVVLTRRETEVMLLLCAGRNNRQIGLHLFISPRTAEKIRLNLYKKVEAKNGAGLILWAVKHGYISDGGAPL